MTEAPPEVASGRIAIGIDVGGSGIKAAVVDVEAGRFRSERLRIATPNPATPEAVISSIGRIVKRLAKASGLGTATPVGVGLPGVTMDDTLKSAANIDPAWVGFPVVERLRKATGRPVGIVNDADAAGIAERVAMNTPIQGASADIIKKAMIAIWHGLREKGIRTRMLLQIHDELLFEAPRAELDAVAPWVKHEMESAVKLSVPVEVGLKAGPDWQTMEKLEKLKAQS